MGVCFNVCICTYMYMYVTFYSSIFYVCFCIDGGLGNRFSMFGCVCNGVMLNICVGF